MDRKELLKSPEYWTASIQMELYRQIEAFMKEKKSIRLSWPNI